MENFKNRSFLLFTIITLLMIASSAISLAVNIPIYRNILHYLAQEGNTISTYFGLWRAYLIGKNLNPMLIYVYALVALPVLNIAMVTWEAYAVSVIANTINNRVKLLLPVFRFLPSISFLPYNKI